MFFKNIASLKIFIFLKENRFIRSCFVASFIVLLISFFLSYFHFLSSEFSIVIKALTGYSKYIFSKTEIGLLYAFFFFILLLNLFISRRVYKNDVFLAKLMAFATMSLFLLILVFTSVIILTN